MVMRLINSVLAGRWRLMEPPAYSLSPEHAEFTRAQPAGDNLNHFQSQLGAGSILLRR